MRVNETWSRLFISHIIQKRAIESAQVWYEGFLAKAGLNVLAVFWKTSFILSRGPYGANSMLLGTPNQATPLKVQ